MVCDLDSTIPDWMIEYPASTRVFDELELDVSCGGKSLRYVCCQQGLDPDLVLDRLVAVVSKTAKIASDATRPGTYNH